LLNLSYYSNYSSNANYSEYINETRYNLTAINQSITNTNLNVTNQFSEVYSNITSLNNSIQDTNNNFTNIISEVYAKLRHEAIHVIRRAWTTNIAFLPVLELRHCPSKLSAFTRPNLPVCSAD
jgi:hypothetical protein